MEEFERKDFAKILKRGALEGHRWMRNTDSTAVRVYDRNLPALPLSIDFYGQYVRVVDYSEAGLDEDAREEAEDLISRFLYTERSRIIWRFRKKREGREQHGKADESLRVSVKEGSLVFETELMSYTDTGLFLDQALTRSAVRDMSAGMNVLNLFSYTGSFSVYAAAGGAGEVVSVDLSNVYCEWARRNLVSNGFLDEKRYRVVASDALGYLKAAYERGERYDLVIFDPPAFSNSHKADDFDVQKDYLGYLFHISRILSAGGAVVFSENLQGFRFAKMQLKPYWKTAEITDEVHAPGFSGKRSGLRVWVLRKTAEMKEIKEPAAGKRRRVEMENEKEEKAGRLSFDEALEKQVAAASEKEGKEKREGGERRHRTEGYGERRDRSGYRDRDRGRSGYRDRYERRDRSDYHDRYDRRDDRFDRPRRYDDRPYGRDDRPRYSDRDRSDYGSRRPDYRDRYSDRPRYGYDRDRERRPYGDKESYRQRESWPGRRFDDERGGYRRERDRSWDNDTGRFYRSERGDRRPGYREPRYSDSGEDRRPFGADKRRRSAPKPYGYDSFMVTKNRDAADVDWLKNTEIRSNSDDE